MVPFGLSSHLDFAFLSFRSYLLLRGLLVATGPNVGSLQWILQSLSCFCLPSYLPASASADFVDLDQLGILEACLLSVLVGVIFFSSRPNKASTAGMSAGNRNIGLNFLLERMLCICCMLWIFVALFQFAVNRFACSLLLLSEDWDCSIFFLSSKEL